MSTRRRADDTVQRVNLLSFCRMSVTDLGLDPKVDYHKQIALQPGKENIESVAAALLSYAREYDGGFPPHAEGAGFGDALAPYLDCVGRMHALYAPRESRVRLMVPPGTRLGSIAERLRSGTSKQIPIAELRGEQGLVFTMVALPVPPESLPDVGEVH
jgi:hypothetical protein